MKRALRRALPWLPHVFTAGLACAHSASDAYLTLSVEQPPNAARMSIRGQWDIALRDLDFVLKLDADGDGHVTWAEVRRRQAAIERYAYPALQIGEPGNVCSIKPGRQMIDDHADGAYAVLFFEVLCARNPKKLHLDYRLFFAIDPSHRGIFVMHSGTNVATSVLAPTNATIELEP